MRPRRADPPRAGAPQKPTAPPAARGPGPHGPDRAGFLATLRERAALDRLSLLATPVARADAGRAGERAAARPPVTSVGPGGGVDPRGTACEPADDPEAPPGTDAAPTTSAIPGASHGHDPRPTGGASPEVAASPAAAETARRIVARFAAGCLASMAVGVGRARLRLAGTGSDALVVDLRLLDGGVEARLSGDRRATDLLAAALDEELARRGFDARSVRCDDG